MEKSHLDRRSRPSPPPTIPPDDPARQLTIARPDQDQSLPHVGLVGDTYTILVAGRDTNGSYTLIDMHVPPGGGPPPHRHDFEEMFTVLDGQVEVTFRGESITARAGATINVPANAPHGFRNAGNGPSRLLCLCAPAGQDEFFTLVGQPVPTRTSPPPPLDTTAQADFVARVQSLAPRVPHRAPPPAGQQHLSFELDPEVAATLAAIADQSAPQPRGSRRRYGAAGTGGSDLAERYISMPTRRRSASWLAVHCRGSGACGPEE